MKKAKCKDGDYTCCECGIGEYVKKLKIEVEQLQKENATLKETGITMCSFRLVLIEKKIVKVMLFYFSCAIAKTAFTALITAAGAAKATI